MRYVTVRVTRDNHTSHSSLVAPWEVPVLEYIFEPGNVTVDVEGQTIAEGEFPEAAAEFGRLMKVYGSDPKSGVPHVTSVYGEGRRGLQSLADAINEAKLAAKPASKVRATRARKLAQSHDPLLA